MSTYKPVNIGELNHEPVSHAQPSSAQRRLPDDEHKKLFAIAGVVGYGFSNDDEIVVYVREGSDQKDIPPHVGGLAVRTEIVGAVTTQS